MSGGTFDYIQFNIRLILDDIKDRLSRQGGLIPEEDLVSDKSWYEKYPEELYYPMIDVEVAKELEKSLYVIEKAIIYIEQIDYIIGGDTGVESFLENLTEELNLLEIKYLNIENDDKEKKI